MGVEYYGILYEDAEIIVAMYLAENMGEDISDYEESAEALLTLFKESDELFGRLTEETNVTSYYAMSSLLRIAELVRRATMEVHSRATFYVALCKLVGIEPRIVSEFTLFPENRPQHKKVIIIDKWYNEQ